MITDARLDLQWWLDFLTLHSNCTLSSPMHLFTDASGNKGWGAFWPDRWLQAEWFPDQAKQNILWKELYAIMYAVQLIHGATTGLEKDLVLL